jgi:hypothetical protein
MNFTAFRHLQFVRAILALLCLGLSGCGEEPDYGTRFFRMIVKFEYKGEPQTYDYVVGCHVPNVMDPKTGETRFAGFIPDIYGQKMKDGKAVVVKTPDFCLGQTNTTGEIQPGNQIGPKVPESFLPFIVVYNDAERMDEGLGYFSSDAYESPYSELKFISTRVTAATRADFDKDGIEGPANVVTRALYWNAIDPGIWKSMGLAELRPLRAADCYYFERYRIREALRPLVREHKPKGDFSYWVATLEDERNWLNSIHAHSGRSRGRKPRKRIDHVPQDLA